MSKTGAAETPRQDLAVPQIYLAIPLAVATVALFWIVPDPPFRHLDDPSHWGVLGYLFTLAVIGRAALSPAGVRGRRVWQLLVLFLVGMPLVYLANWVRFGGSATWLAIELAGAAIYIGIALLAVYRTPWLLAAGIAGHAAWDAFHYGRAGFVPDWYVIGCVVIDLALGAWAAGLVPAWNARRLTVTDPCR